jgi:hypothetical protein
LCTAIFQDDAGRTQSRLGKACLPSACFFVVGVSDAMKQQDVLRSGHTLYSAKNFGHVSDMASSESKKVSRR